MVLGALSQALPGEVIAAANGANTTAVFAGVDPRSNKPYVYLETLGGGMGARSHKDGKDGVQVHITNTSNLPVESIEQEYPLRVEEYSLIEDSGGAGQFRGGMGLRRILTPVDHKCVFNGAGERFRYKPWGLFGGQSGASGQFLMRESGKEHRLDDKPNKVPVEPGTRIVIETPGAGGYGSPKDRMPEAVAQDHKSKKFSGSFIEQHFGQVSREG